MASKKLQKIIRQDNEYLFQNYGARKEVCFVKGNGSFLYDQDGKEYIDFFAGIAVCNLGYNNKALTAALHKQADKLLHSSNNFLNQEQNEAASLISELSFPGKTLFVNSGTEANEAAIKLARRYGLSINKKRFKIVSFLNSFHGRTMGSMTATGQKRIHDGFGPLPEGFMYLPYNDINAFKKTVKKNKDITAVIMELVQGEGGVVPAHADFVNEVFNICQRNNILTIVDEVQTGIGRTGTLFAYQQYGVIPDIITLAKALGGGIPIGAMHAKDFLVSHLEAGSHGCTFGGNHFSCAAAIAVLNEIKKPAFVKNTAKISAFFMQTLQEIKNETPIIKDVRGLGMHIGVELTVPGAAIVAQALAAGLIINCTAVNVLRIAPPLNISLEAAGKGLAILRKILLEAGKQL